MHTSDGLRDELRKERESKSTSKKKRVEDEFSQLVLSSFKGDYLQLQTNVKVMRALAAQGDNSVLFSDEICKWNRRNVKQTRVLLLTANALHVLRSGSFDPSTRMAVRDIKGVSLSRLSPDVFAIHHASSPNDLLLSSSKRSEVVYNLQRMYHEACGTFLRYSYTERIFVTDRGGNTRQAVISNSHEVLLTKAVGPAAPPDVLGSLPG